MAVLSLAGLEMEGLEQPVASLSLNSMPSYNDNNSHYSSVPSLVNT